MRVVIVDSETEVRGNLGPNVLILIPQLDVTGSNGGWTSIFCPDEVTREQLMENLKGDEFKPLQLTNDIPSFTVLGLPNKIKEVLGEFPPAL